MSRRAVIAGLAASGTAVFAEAPQVSIRPVARPSRLSLLRPQARIGIQQMIADAGLTGKVGILVADANTGTVIDAIDPDTQLPPASVNKAITALYALEGLGADYRFRTSIYATAPVIDGKLDGDLILAGGGDPNLVTDDLFTLAERVKDAGIREVTGKFLVWGEALRGVDEIDDGQLDHLGYNPSVSGLNLNFNRVYFEWKREGEQYTVSMDARSETLRPEVTSSLMQVVDRKTPVYDYHDGGNVDRWTVARRALGNAGSRWLPVRYPELYAGDVFRTLMRSHGVVLPRAAQIEEMPECKLIAAFESAPLRDIMRSMLRFSTNITAEATGLAATTAIAGTTRGLRTSALSMARWAEKRADIAPIFVDHSGLGDASRVSAKDMVNLLSADGVSEQLRPIMKRIVLRDAKGAPLVDQPGEVRAKTGTLNFVTTLAGYITTSGGRELTFAIFAADLEARERSKQSADERPAGTAGFNGRVKRLRQNLLQRWASAGDLQSPTTVAEVGE